MKKNKLTKKLIIATIIWLILLGAAGSAYFWLNSDIQYYESEAKKKSSQFQSNLVQLGEIAKNIKQSEEASKLYNEYANSANNNKEEFRRNTLVRKLGEITNELGTVKMSFKMEEFKPYPTIEGNDDIQIEGSLVTIKFSALTDVDAIKILKKIPEKLNGTVYYKSFDMKKINEIDSNILLSISNGNEVFLVNGNLVFDWISVRVTPESEKSEEDAAQPPEGAPNV